MKIFTTVMALIFSVLPFIFLIGIGILSIFISKKKLVEINPPEGIK